MKKRLLSLLITGIIGASFIACGNESEKVEEPAAETEAKEEVVEEETPEDTDAEIEVVEGFTHTPEYDAALANAEVYGGSDENTYDDIKSAYENVITDLEENSPLYEDYYNFTYSLAYINEDDVPELICNSNDENFGIYLVSYYDGKAYMAVTNGLEFSYIEKQNVLDNTGIVLGAYYDNVLAIRDGQWVLLGYGEQGTSDPWAEDSFDENGNPIIDMWTWNDDELKNSKEYDEKLALLFDTDASNKIVSYVSREDILTQIEEL